jgi:hypothetical protein
MPLLNTKLYDSGLIEMNEDLMCVFVEAHNRAGGGRDTVYLRQHDRGVPLTMRNDFSDSGYLDYSTTMFYFHHKTIVLVVTHNNLLCNTTMVIQNLLIEEVI